MLWYNIRMTKTKKRLYKTLVKCVKKNTTLIIESKNTAQENALMLLEANTG